MILFTSKLCYFFRMWARRRGGWQLTHWSDTHLHSRLWEEGKVQDLSPCAQKSSTTLFIGFLPLAFQIILLCDFFSVFWQWVQVWSQTVNKKSAHRERVNVNLPRRWLSLKRSRSELKTNWWICKHFPVGEVHFLSFPMMMDGGRSPGTSTPERASFGKTQEEKTRVNWWNLGSPQTAAVLWGSQMVTQKASSSCSYSYSRRKWIRRGGELVFGHFTQ